MIEKETYIMESELEWQRLEAKTDRAETLRQLKLVGMERDNIKQALDAGAGTGAVARVMSELIAEDGKVTALDRSKSRLQQGERLAVQHQINNIEFVCGDVMSPPLPQGSFDFVWSRFLFEYLPEPEVAMDRLLELVAPGGRLVVGDLDGNAVYHDGMDPELARDWARVVNSYDKNFDPYAGRKLFRYFAQRQLQQIEVHCFPYHLYAGPIPEHHLPNWETKLHNAHAHALKVLGSEKRYHRFAKAFLAFLKAPDTLTYSVLFLVSGVKSR